jgi:release factor glutamine methyltransferase
VNIGEIYRRGYVVFMGVEVLVAPGALVPREETELLGQAALDAIGHPGLRAPRLIDMCCGCGNLACGIAHRRPDAQVWACDLTDRCIEVARRNVANLGLAERVHVCQGDLFAGLRELGLEKTMDAIVCNPPYISEKRLDGDRAHLLSHEPREAFDGGPYGLAIHQRVLRDAQAFLRRGGVLLFEIGLGQAGQIRMLFERARAYEDVRFLSDAAGEARVALARMK